MDIWQKLILLMDNFMILHILVRQMPITGQWNPKKYVGGYGTTGFYLNFSTDTLGTDRSGNGNDFTPHNFSVSCW